ncbi:MAG: FHA domain-containing protein [Myxococcota bacterium]
MSTFLLKLSDMRFPVRIGETLLGRSPYCSIVLEDARVSRQHAVIRLTAEGLAIQDLGSRNGTLVNGETLRGTLQLKPGDIVQLGAQRLQIELAAEPTTATRHRLAETGDYTAARHEENSQAETPTEPGAGPSLRTGARKVSPPAGTGIRT